jgi:murein DD-endopeptidase MepM/ murein hydrolase activator NlpD
MAALSTVKKIKDSENNLSQSVQKQKEMSQRLDIIAKDIKKAEKENIRLNKKLEVLSQEYSKNEASYQASKKKLAEYERNLSSINKKIEEKKKRYINLLAQQVSVIQAMGQIHEPTAESVIKHEVYTLYKKQNAKELASLKRQIDKGKAEKRKIAKNRKYIKKKIDRLTRQRKEYKKKRKSKEALLKKLAMDEEAYRKKLQKTIDTQSALRSTLADLNILRKKEVEEERRREAEQKAAMLAEEKRKKEERRQRELARKKARKEGKKVVYNTKVESTPVDRQVKKVGSSYHKDKVYAYRGSKTISPLPGARLVKSFGTYVDPVYKIKIFNESVTLKAPRSNAKVYNVLNGKVVFSGASSMLGKVVVVSHSGKMHTVYAGLSKIAPTIRVGSKIKKGYVIGKVSRKLIFEATKNSKHINPMKLIRL